MKTPSKNQWKHLFSVLTKREKISFFIFLFLFFASLFFLLREFYVKNTKVIPAKGGEYTEGVIGFPRWIQPIYSPLSGVDRNLVELIFSGLIKYENGKPVPDLASHYKILEKGKVYEVYLKKNLFWSDGKPLTADDVIFTIDAIQNPDTKSPLRTAWLGVKTEKISGPEGEGLRFTLKNPSAVFLQNLTIKIIPEHIWSKILPKNFSLAGPNLSPVGSGIYKLKNLLQDDSGRVTSLSLVENPFYFAKKPYIPNISFRFFDSKASLMKAFKRGEIDGFRLSDNNSNTIKKFLNGYNLYSFSLPRYFAVFFNLKDSKILSDKEVRKALNYATDKKEILEKVLYNQGRVINSPILPGIYGFEKPENIYQYNPEKANNILEEAGFSMQANGIREKVVEKKRVIRFKSNLSVGSRGEEVKELQKCLSKDKEVYPDGEVSGYFGKKTKEAVIAFQEKYKDSILKPLGLKKGNGQVRGKTREKLNEVCFPKTEDKIPLTFSLTTANQPLLIKTASLLKSQWKKIGADVEIKTFNIATLEREILRKRNFEALLFGEVLGEMPDPFPFWHSSQRGEIGLNLSNYNNKKADKLLEQERQTLDKKERKKDLEDFQKIIIDDSPAVFLYNPGEQYLLAKKIKGIKEGMITDPSKRFIGISNWYIKTKRVWK